jgi:predicted phosphodiesterase
MTRCHSRLRVFLCVLLLAATCLAASARNLDGTLGLIMRPISTVPTIVKAGEAFDLAIRADQPVQDMRVLMYLGPQMTPLLSHTREQPPLEPKDGVVTVQVTVPNTVQPALYNLYVRADPPRRGDTAERAVKVISQWPDTYSFAHVTDVHIGRQDPPFRDQVFKRTASEINRLGVDFVLLTGDLTDQGTPEQYRLFLQLLDNFDVPTYTTPGNHDRGENAGFDKPNPIYERYCGPANYTFDFGRHRYVSLDTRWEDEFLVFPTYRAWLEAQLQRSNPALGVAFSHRISDAELPFYEEQLPAHNYKMYVYGHTHDDVIDWVGARRLMLVNTSQELMSTYNVLRISADDVVQIRHFHRPSAE